MALDPIIEKNISAFVEGQFPLFYRDHGPVFVAFLRKYYEWMESEGQVLHHARSIPQNRDIDTAVDDFIVHFKEQYLKNIQLETTTNVRQLVKHSLDIYRSRGSERAIDLLFRLVFGVGATVYYPSEDIFRLSDNDYIKPTYLEVAHHTGLDKFVGKTIRGEASGATAFVERYVRKKSPGKYTDILYISAIHGTFKAGERLNTTVNPLLPDHCPILVGSLTGVDITGGSAGFKVGDIVPLSSASGYGAKGRVVAVEKNYGTTKYELIDGGFGYTANHQVLISDKILTINNITIDPALNNGKFYYSLFEQVVQPMADIGYEAATGTLYPGDNIYTYDANGVSTGHGVITTVKATNTTAGDIHVSIRAGDLNKTNFYTTGNVVSANVRANSYMDHTATGNVIGIYEQSVMGLNNITGDFAVGEMVYQGNTTATVKHIESDTLFLTRTDGIFSPGNIVRGMKSNASANIQTMEIKAGVVGVNGHFMPDPHAWFYSATSNTAGYLTRVSQGVGASIIMSTVMDHPETVSIYTDPISGYLSTPLSSTDYGFPAVGAETLSTVIDTALTSTSYTMGRFSMIASYNGGKDYTDWPVVRIYDPFTYSFKKTGCVIDLEADSGVFHVGEIVTQESTGAKGMVIQANNKSLSLRRLSFHKDFARTEGNTSILVGVSSGVSANAVMIFNTSPPGYREINGEYIGMNAMVHSSAATAEGTVTSMDVVDSGYGYVPGERITFVSGNNVLGTAVSRVESQGNRIGYFKTRDGFLSDDKKLYDGHYYQDYSYEVRSSITLDRYADMLKSVLHVAGTKAFGGFYHNGWGKVVLAGSSVTQQYSKARSTGSGTVAGAGASTAAATGNSSGSAAASGGGMSTATATAISAGMADSTATGAAV